MTPVGIVRHVFERLAQNDVSVFDTHCHPHLKVYSGSADEARTRDEMRQSITAFHTAFSEYRLEVHDVVAAGDKVVLRGTSSGVHTGPWQALPPTGRCVRYAEMLLLHVDGDRIARAWLLHDNAHLLQQLGAAATPSPAAEAAAAV